MSEEEYIKKLGKRIAKKREELGLSRADLATKVEIARMQIYRIEEGQNPTNIITLRRIAKILGVNLGELVDLK